MSRPNLTPEMETFVKEAEERLVLEAETMIPSFISQLLSEGDVLILSVLGVDAKRKILDVFINQCQKLKGDLENGTE